MRKEQKPLGRILKERVSAYITDLRNTPDPWSQEDEDAIQDPEARQVCSHCLRQLEPGDHFCPDCNASVGDYNNLMPFERIFAQGEVLRNGVGPQAHLTPFRLLSFGTIGLLLLGPFAPLYWFRLYRRCKQERSHNEI